MQWVSVGPPCWSIVQGQTRRKTAATPSQHKQPAPDPPTPLTSATYRATTTLAARGSTADVFGEIGGAIATLRQLQTASAAAVAVLLLLAHALAAANAVLLARWGGGSGGGAGCSASGSGINGELRRRRLAWLLAANQAAVIVAAFALAGTFAWLADMRLISGAAGGAEDSGSGGGGGYGPWFPPAPAAYPAAPPPVAPTQHAAATAAAATAAASGVTAGNPPAPCPRNCIDLGALAPALGLPWHCVCLPAFLLTQLARRAARAVLQLAAATAGAALALAGTSSLASLSAAQLAAECGAARTARWLARGGGGARGGVGGGIGASEPLLGGGGGEHRAADGAA